MSTDKKKPPPTICLATSHGRVARRFRYTPLVHQVEDLFYDAIWNKKPRYLYILLEDDGKLMALSLTSAFQHRVIQGLANRTYKDHKKSGMPPVHIMSLDLRLPFDDQIRSSSFFSPELAQNFDVLRDHRIETIHCGGDNLLEHAKPAGFLTGPKEVSPNPATQKLADGTWIKRVINNGMIERTPFAGSPTLAYPAG